MLADFVVEFFTRTDSTIVPRFNNTLSFQSGQMDFQLISQIRVAVGI
jgi:hypothetical protein